MGFHGESAPDQGFLIFPYQFHYYSDIFDSNIVWLILTFELQNPVVMESFRNQLINLYSDAIEQLTLILQDYRESNTPRTNSRLIIKSASLINYLREYPQGGPKVTISQQSATRDTWTELINSIPEFLTRNSGTLQSVSNIAQASHMSESNLRAHFRQHFNISLGAYLKNYRSHQAILYLQNPNLSLTEIAFELGFTTLSAFSRIFQQFHQRIPTHLQQAIRSAKAVRYFEEFMTRFGFFIWHCWFLRIELLIRSTELTAEALSSQ